MRKSERTRAALIDHALGMVCHDGFNGLSIGALADGMGMSKSGVFARFGSHEQLLLEVIKLGHRMFTEQVTVMSLEESRGVARLRGAFRRWAGCVVSGNGVGRIYLKGALELECDSTPVQQELRALVADWQDRLAHFVTQAAQAGEIADDSDARQIVFELYGLMYAIYHEGRFMMRHDAMARGMAAFDRLVAQKRVPEPAPVVPARRSNALAEVH